MICLLPITLNMKKNHFSDIYPAELQLRGRPFDSEGGGELALLVGTDYLFSSRARPGNLFLGKPRTEYLFSTATNFWKKQKKKKKKKKKKGGGERGVSARV